MPPENLKPPNRAARRRELQQKSGIETESTRALALSAIPVEEEEEKATNGRVEIRYDFISIQSKVISCKFEELWDNRNLLTRLKDFENRGILPVLFEIYGVEKVLNSISQLFDEFKVISDLPYSDVQPVNYYDLIVRLEPDHSRRKSVYSTLESRISETNDQAQITRSIITGLRELDNPTTLARIFEFILHKKPRTPVSDYPDPSKLGNLLVKHSTRGRYSIFENNLREDLIEQSNFRGVIEKRIAEIQAEYDGILAQYNYITGVLNALPETLRTEFERKYGKLKITTFPESPNGILDNKEFLLR
jgi:hypothetical protein